MPTTTAAIAAAKGNATDMVVPKAVTAVLKVPLAAAASKAVPLKANIATCAIVTLPVINPIAVLNWLNAAGKIFIADIKLEPPQSNPVNNPNCTTNLPKSVLPN